MSIDEISWNDNFLGGWASSGCGVCALLDHMDINLISALDGAKLKPGWAWQ